MRGAVSSDPGAAAASWRKWNGTHFSRANTGEDSERFRDVNNARLPNGEHPTIHWNRLVSTKLQTIHRFSQSRRRPLLGQGRLLKPMDRLQL